MPAMCTPGMHPLCMSRFVCPVCRQSCCRPCPAVSLRVSVLPVMYTRVCATFALLTPLLWRDGTVVENREKRGESNNEAQSGPLRPCGPMVLHVCDCSSLWSTLRSCPTLLRTHNIPTELQKRESVVQQCFTQRNPVTYGL